MYMRPCGPVRHSLSRSNRSPKSVIKVEYWINMCACSGTEVGDTIEVSLTGKEMTALLDAIVEGDRSSEMLAKFAPALAAKFDEACRNHQLRQMALDVYGDYDFSDSRFKSMRKGAKIRHIMSEAAEGEPFQLRYQIQENG